MVIRDPRSRDKLPPYGASVPDTSYWVRRLKCEDVVKTTQAAIDKGMAEAAKEASAKTEEKSPEPKQKPSNRGGR